MKALLLLATGVVGLIETVAPRFVVRAWTRVAFRNSGDVEPREWVYAGARAEGAVFVAGALVGLYRLAAADDPSEANASTRADDFDDADADGPSTN
ncbi:hypothetical protein [Halorubrum laminariae]|uniref:DUF6199 domain-containing protein n=1 Tax=Halorubrum laminariae TaxID=1433523 RepID=A0ABD6C4I6_9EURY|nr:hypothetical protein [Halorubrum laminariae]